MQLLLFFLARSLQPCLPWTVCHQQWVQKTFKLHLTQIQPTSWSGSV